MKYLSVKELAEKLAVKESWLRSQVFKRNIPFIKIGALIRFDPEEVSQWINSKKVNPQEIPPGQGPPVSFSRN